jgi:valyl-tRNA synthetase
MWQELLCLPALVAAASQSHNTKSTKQYLLINAICPEYKTEYADAKATTELEFIKKLILGVRNIRGEMNIAPSKQLPVMLANYDAAQQQLITQNLTLITSLAKLGEVTWLDGTAVSEECATTVVDNLELFIPMRGVIDITAEITRLTKELDNTTIELQKITGRLNNENYMAKAPQAVIAKEQERAAELLQLQDKLQVSLAKLAS